MTSTISSVPQVHSGDRAFLHQVETAPLSGADREGPTLADFGSTAHRLFAEATLHDTVAEVTGLARQRYGADAVGVVLQGGEGTTAPVSTHDPAAYHLDELQVSLRQGPALQAIERRQPVIVTDFRSDSRWRFWAPLAADTGFRSTLSVPLADGDLVGALTLYAKSTSQFQPKLLASVAAFAHLAAIAIAVAQERQQLMEAVTSHALVGQAQGILMERYGVSSEQAFTVLRRYSSHLNQKLRVVAEGVIQDRQLPEMEASDQDPSPRSATTLRAG
jgi:GAF domain-containing protein